MKYLTADFGSTYTKVTAIDTVKEEIIATGAAFTTIETNVMDGLEKAIEDLNKKIPSPWKYDKFLCCSSAAGGLKMIASGLVPELTAKAARMAASSAGAKVVKTFAFEISQREAREIENIQPDLILLCGGTDGGNRETIIHNAQMLSNLQGDFTIIVAGNKNAEETVSEILTKSKRNFVVTDNVMPDFNTLNILPAKNCIMNLFIESIIEAKGLSAAQAIAANKIIPTPLAVLNACELLSKGTHIENGIGELLAVDLGGATTDVYSIAKGEPSASNIIQRGLPEPESKRTVEGDLGMRYSLSSLSEEMDLYGSAIEVNATESELQDWITQCIENKSKRANTPKEANLEKALSKAAIKIATERHVGKMTSVFTPMGQAYTIDGKDLTRIKYILGIGGALIHSTEPIFILSGAKFDLNSFEYAKPKEPDFLLDSSYIMASMGLLSQELPDVALRIMKKELKTL